MWVKCDFHVHTTRSDGRLPPKEVLKLYRKNNYDVVAITDHDKLTKPEYIPADLLWISGEEYTASKPMFHILLLFINNEVRNDKDYRKEILQGALAFIAHPYTTNYNQVIDAEVRRGLTFHGVEFVNGIADCLTYCPGYAFRGIGNSDGHGIEIAPYCSVASYLEADKNPDDVYEALLDNRVVVECRGWIYYSMNPRIAKKFEREFNKKVIIVNPNILHILYYTLLKTIYPILAYF